VARAGHPAGEEARPMISPPFGCEQGTGDTQVPRDTHEPTRHVAPRLVGLVVGSGGASEIVKGGRLAGVVRSVSVPAPSPPRRMTATTTTHTPDRAHTDLPGGSGLMKGVKISPGRARGAANLPAD